VEDKEGGEGYGDIVGDVKNGLMGEGGLVWGEGKWDGI
jgi:hypothetical protein